MISWEHTLERNQTSSQNKKTTHTHTPQKKTKNNQRFWNNYRDLPHNLSFVPISPCEISVVSLLPLTLFPLMHCRLNDCTPDKKAFLTSPRLQFNDAWRNIIMLSVLGVGEYRCFIVPGRDLYVPIDAPTRTWLSNSRCLCVGFLPIENALKKLGNERISTVRWIRGFSVAP